MVGGMTARTHDYLWLLVDASAWALFSALVTDICVKFEQGGRRGSGQHASLVVRWSPRTAWRSCCEERNLYLARSSRATLEKMNPSLKRGIMQAQTFVCSRRP
jgi:hypothetical protein